MKEELRLKRFIAGDRQEVFQYFIKPEFLEKWAYPDGMTLKIPEMDARDGGSYRFIHSNQDGSYNCTGHFKEIDTDKRIVQVDDAVVAPDQRVIFTDLETVTTFDESDGGTLVTIVQRGFPDKKTMDECESGWKQCLDKLDELFGMSENHQSDVDLGSIYPD